MIHLKKKFKKGCNYGSRLIILGIFFSSMPNILIGCRRYCSPDPCQNGALCVEKWNDYQCICTNKWAHSGHSCETSKCF